MPSIDVVRKELVDCQEFSLVFHLPLLSSFMSSLKNVPFSFLVPVEAVTIVPKVVCILLFIYFLSFDEKDVFYFRNDLIFFVLDEKL